MLVRVEVSRRLCASALKFKYWLIYLCVLADLALLPSWSLRSI
ncbi:hypothetical protein SCG7109_AK_00010 [Chlamydiales bacterium SCGC AG-110-M15]|nr:hypothetical protein SCG7109_AK_00010 [Chlamydiales bacterium SCGC AG-110-M15]